MLLYGYRMKGIGIQLHSTSSELLEFTYLRPLGAANNMVSSINMQNLKPPPNYPRHLFSEHATSTNQAEGTICLVSNHVSF